MLNLNKMSVKWFVVAILAVSAIVHFSYFGHPAETVFDEVHFGKFISGYFTGEYFFDIHPPLGKLLISGMGLLTGFEPGFDFASIGDDLPNKSYLWLRLLPIIAGTLLPIIIFLLALELGLSKIASFTAGILISLENSFLVQSRFILLDSFLLLFGFTALLLYFKYRWNQKINYLVLSGFFGALALSIKWTGGTFLAIILVIEARRLLKDGALKNNLKKTMRAVTSLIVVPFAIYFAIFVLHFYLLDKSGPGDAFMTPEFRKTLSGSADASNTQIKPRGILGKFVELNTQMYQANSRLTATHPYSSKWYSWPFMARPIYYWDGGADAETGAQARIYFLGNPIIWWSTAVAVIFLIINILIKLTGWVLNKVKDNEPMTIPVFLAGGFLFNLLPFIGVGRVLFLYHYMTAYIFGIIIMAYTVNRIDSEAKKKMVLAGLVFLATASFIYFSPLSYGLPIDSTGYEGRMWFNGWK